MKSKIVATAGVLSVLLCGRAGAGQCNVFPVPAGSEAELEPDGRLVKLIDVLDDCEKLTHQAGVVVVRSGTVAVAWTSNASDVPQYVVCAENKPCKIEAPESASCLFKRSQQYGGSRMGESGNPLVGVPRGTILDLQNALVFDFGKAGLGSWELILTDETRAELFRQKGESAVVELDPDLVIPGRRYAWVIRAVGKEFRDTFRVLAESDSRAQSARQALMRALEQITPERDEHWQRTVAEMLTYQAHSLSYEASLRRRELGL